MSKLIDRQKHNERWTYNDRKERQIQRITEREKTEVIQLGDYTGKDE